MVLDRLDHNGVLFGRSRDLHPPGRPDGRMGDIAVPGDLIGGVDDDDALVHFIGEHARHLPQHGRLAHTGPAKEEDAFAGLDDVFNSRDGAVNGTTDAAGEADNAASAVTDARYAVKGPLDAGPVVFPEITDPVDDVLDVDVGDLVVAENGLARGEACFGHPAQVHHNFKKVMFVAAEPQGVGNPGRQSIKKKVEVVRDRAGNLGYFRQVTTAVLGMLGMSFPRRATLAVRQSSDT